MPVTIRKARVKNISQVVEMAVELLMHHARLDRSFTPKRGARKSFWKYLGGAIYSRKKQLLVAEHAGKITGFALGEILMRPPVVDKREVGGVNSVFVAKREHRFHRFHFPSGAFLGAL